MKIDTGIECMHFQHIPAKSPDVPSMDYCVLDLLKRAFSKRKSTMIDGLWKILEEEWKAGSFTISPFIIEITMKTCFSA